MGKRAKALGLALVLTAGLSVLGACGPKDSGNGNGDSGDGDARPALGVATNVLEPGKSHGIRSVPNLRDLGGYEAGAGATVARGLLYRSDQLAHISEDDMGRLAALKLVTDFDLRTAEERDARPDELPEGVREVWLDVLADADQSGAATLEKLLKDPEKANDVLGGGKAAADFAAGYRDFVSLPSAKKAFAALFTAIGDQEQLPALFHCTTGKDRTGWAAAAFLTFLGVSRETVFEDFLRSNDYILPKYQRVIDDFVAAGGEASIPEALLGVRREYLEASFGEMERTYGSIERYFSEGLGIDDAQQAALKGLYLEEK